MPTPPDIKYTKAQQAFLQQRAHQMLVEWANEVMLGGDMKATLQLDPNDPYVRYAATRKTPWISHKGGGQFFMVGPGWSAATSFLKR